MSTYRRWYVPGGTFFFTLVTHLRRPIFKTPEARRMLKLAVDTIRESRPFQTIAYVLLPDHLHVIWQLPRGDCDYSTRWKRIKEEFTTRFLDSGASEGLRSDTMLARGERGVWQRRFWEHTIENESDLERCANYVHWNPKKHGYVSAVRDWPWSTFHQFVKAGEYEEGWEAADPTPLYNAPEWGDR